MTSHADSTRRVFAEMEVNAPSSTQPQLAAQGKDPEEICKDLQDLSKVAAEADQQSGTIQTTQEAKKPTTGNKAEIKNGIK